MMLTGGGPVTSSPRPITDYELSLSETFGVAARNAFDNSLAADLWREGRTALEGLSRAGAYSRGATIRYTAEEARAKAKTAGVDIAVPDDGIGFDDFDTLLALRQRQGRDADLLSMRPRTTLGWAAEMGGSFAGFAADPINVAAAFIPFVGEARYAAALERAGGFFGRAGVRATAGAIEGAAGAAVVEPLTLALNAKYEPEYTAVDSFLNIAFGGLLGGGLHVVGGGLADVLSPSRRAASVAPEVKSRQALSEAVMASDNGIALNVAPVFRGADQMLDPARDSRFVARETARAIDVLDADIERAKTDLAALRSGVENRPADLVETIKAMGGIRLTDLEGRVTSEGGDVRATFDKRYPPGLVNNKKGIPLDAVRERLQEDGWLRPWDGEGENPTSTNDVLDLLSQWVSGNKPTKIGEAAGDDLRGLADEVKAAGVRASDSDDVAAFKVAKRRQERAYADHLARDMGDWAVEPEVYDPVTRQEPAEYRMIREQAEVAARAANDDAAAIDGEIEALGEYLDMARAREVLTPADEAALALADEFEARAARDGRAYRAAAACMSGLA